MMANDGTVSDDGWINEVYKDALDHAFDLLSSLTEFRFKIFEKCKTEGDADYAAISVANVLLSMAIFISTTRHKVDEGFINDPGFLDILERVSHDTLNTIAYVKSNKG